MFTGNGSGDTLTAALHRAGFANQPTSHQRDDGLQLRDAFLTAVARCAPPGNKPTREEMDNCQGYLVRELALLASTRVVLTLGRIAFDRYRRLLQQQGATLPRLTFHHGACYRLEPPLPALVVSYHPSRQNTQTGRLTEEMLDEVLAQVRRLLDEG
jgi:uracil-DNA glycosylase family 4